MGQVFRSRAVTNASTVTDQDRPSQLGLPEHETAVETPRYITQFFRTLLMATIP
jgi:hypothetical protein